MYARPNELINVSMYVFMNNERGLQLQSATTDVYASSLFIDDTGGATQPMHSIGINE